MFVFCFMFFIKVELSKCITVTTWGQIVRGDYKEGEKERGVYPYAYKSI